MTNIRAPRTFAHAMTRVAGLLGYERCCKIVRKSDRTVRYWSEERSTKRPTIVQALQLDVAYRLAGGEGSPFLDTFIHQSDVTIEAATACHRALAGDIATFARESGEAIAAGLAVTNSNASTRDIIRAVAEVEQVESALTAIRRRLASFVTFGAGSNATEIGGTQ
jgi:hypothetical protein